MEESDYKVKICSHDEVNHFRIINLLYRIAPSAVRVKFDKELHPSVLENTLKTDRYKIMEPLRKKKVINQTQWDLLYPKTGVVSSTTFDLTLMICLLRNLASIPVGDILPHTSDTSKAADLSRLKNYRNHFAHDGYSLTDADFELYWTDISQAIQRLGGPKFERECSDLKLFKLTEINKEILIQLINSEKAASTPDVLLKLNAERVKVWRDEEKKVVETRALSCIKELLEKNNIIVAVGSSGCGKSTAIHHAALQLNYLEDYAIVPVDTPGKIIRYCEPNIKQVFVIDDVCGKSTIDSIRVNKWTRWSADIEKIVNDYKVKILLSSRTHIYRDRSFKNLKVLTKSSCDLESEYRLSNEERNQIASEYLTVNEVNALQKMGVMDKFSFFPLLCRMYSGFAERELIKSYDFFSNPIRVIRDDLELLMNAPDQTTFATLTLFIAYNNTIHEELLSKKSGIKEVLEDISDYFHMQARFSIPVVKSELDKLILSYVKNTEKTFRILHEKIYDIFLSFCGEHFVYLVLEVAHKDVIRDRFLLESTQNQNQTKDKNVIKISVIKEQNYFERILKDIQKGSIKDIFLNRQFKYLTFRNKLFQYLQFEVDLKKELLDVSSEDLSNMLLSMTRQCYWDMVPILLTEHVDVNVRDWKGTRLYFASEKGNVDIAKLLLDHQADPNLKGWLETASPTPLHVAVDSCNLDLVTLLLDRHADANIERNYIGMESPLHLATKKKSDSIVKALLEHKADSNIYDQWNRTPLYETVSQGNSKLTMLLLNHGADPNIGEKDHNNTPLHIAFSKGNIDMIKILVDYKGDLNIKNVKGETPLFQAVEKNHTDIVSFQIKCKSDLNIWNYKNESLLCKASRMGHTNIVKLLLEHNCDANVCNKKNESPLYISSMYGHADTLMLLLEHNCDPNICNNDNEPPLFAASENGHTDIVRLLLEHQCDSRKCNINNESPLFVASANGHFDIVRLLLEHNCNPDMCNDKNESPLIIASKEGHTNIVKLLLKRTCNPNMCNDRNESPLFIASKEGNYNIVKLLLEHNCYPNMCNHRVESPLFIASKKGHHNIVKLLLERSSVKMKNEEKISSFIAASKNGHTDIVRLFLEHNCDPNSFIERYESVLYVAIEEGHSDIVKLLLEHKCDPKICNDKNESPLFIASMYGKTDIVKLFLENHCDPNFCNAKNESPLFAASQYGHIDIVRLLLEKDYDLTICNDKNKSPLFIASKNGQTDIVKLLLEHNCDPNMFNNKHESPLFLASKEGHPHIVKLLLEHNCDPKICNYKKESPLFIASSWGCFRLVRFVPGSPFMSGQCNWNYTEIVKLLLEHNCDPNTCNAKNETALFAASKNGHTDIVGLLLKHKCDVNILNDKNESPLFIASMYSQTEIIKSLFEQLSDPTLCIDEDEAHVSIASMWFDRSQTLLSDFKMLFRVLPSDQNYTQIVKLLLEHNCDTNACNAKNESALFGASKYGRPDIVELLLKHKCDPNICNDKKESPLFIASMSYQIETRQLLFKKYGYSYTCDDKNESPLSTASVCVKSRVLHPCLRLLFDSMPSEHSYTQIVKLLLEYNCDFKICNDNNESALSIASKKGRTDIEKLLLKHICDVF